MDAISAKKVTEMNFEKNNEVFKKPGLAKETFEDKGKFQSAELSNCA